MTHYSTPSQQYSKSTSISSRNTSVNVNTKNLQIFLPVMYSCPCTWQYYLLCFLSLTVLLHLSRNGNSPEGSTLEFLPLYGHFISIICSSSMTPSGDAPSQGHSVHMKKPAGLTFAPYNVSNWLRATPSYCCPCRTAGFRGTAGFSNERHNFAIQRRSVARVMSPNLDAVTRHLLSLCHSDERACSRVSHSICLALSAFTWTITHFAQNYINIYMMEMYQ